MTAALPNQNPRFAVYVNETLNPGTAREILKGTIHFCPDKKTYDDLIRIGNEPAFAEELKILDDPTLFEKITINEFDKKIIREIDTRQAIFLNLCGVFVENHNTASFNLCVDSSSGAGKDKIAKAVIEYFPKEITFSPSRISPTAFNYWHTNDPAFSWDGKAVYLEDIPNNVLNSEVFKVMSSSGSKAVIVINGKAQELEVRGKPVMIITTATAEPNSENLRRFPRISLDESIDQTKGIMKRQAKYAAEGKAIEYNETIKRSITLLRRVKVKIPYAEKLPDHFPQDHIIMRTHFNRFLDLIKASAALHQYQRKNDLQGFVIADSQDYDIARIALMKSTSNRLMIPLTKKQRLFVEFIEKNHFDEWFSVPDVMPKITFLSEQGLYKTIEALRENFLDCEKREKENAKKPVNFYKLKKVFAVKIPEFKELSLVDITDRNDLVDLVDLDATQRTQGGQGIASKSNLSISLKKGEALPEKTNTFSVLEQSDQAKEVLSLLSINKAAGQKTTKADLLKIAPEEVIYQLRSKGKILEVWPDWFEPAGKVDL